MGLNPLRMQSQNKRQTQLETQHIQWKSLCRWRGHNPSEKEGLEVILRIKLELTSFIHWLILYVNLIGP